MPEKTRLVGVNCGVCGYPAVGMLLWPNGYREIHHRHTRRPCGIGAPPVPEAREEESHAAAAERS